MGTIIAATYTVALFAVLVWDHVRNPVARAEGIAEDRTAALGK
jgi:hypothetical protein